MDKKKVVQFSAIGFIISAIGAAVGLGNIWWFPQRMVENGGSTFIIVYFVVLILFALPIVLLELNYGVFFRKNVVGSLGKAGGAFGSLMGWKQVVLIAFLSIYYLVILSWIGVTLVISSVPAIFSEWAKDPEWFDKKILNSKVAKDTVAFAPWVLLASVVLVFITFLILSGGIRKGLEVANYIFVPGFFFILAGLTVYAVFFRKFGDAGADALFSFDFKKMGDPFVWHSAVKQVTFSTGILLGILVLFSSSSDVRMDKGNEAIIIVFADTFIALIAGLLISSLIANNEGMKLEEAKGIVPTKEQVVDQVKARFDSGEVGGSRLLFRYLPPLFLGMNASATAFGLGNGLMIAFILTLLFAGISSLIALAEVFIEAVRNALGLKNFASLSIWALLAFALVGFYSTSFGGTLIDNQDAIVMTFVLLIGIVEVIMFTVSPQYSKAIVANDKHTFLKLSPLRWFRILLFVVPIPLLFIFGVFGAMNFFGLNYLIANSDAFEKLRTKHSFFQEFYEKSKGTKFVVNMEQIVSLVFFGFSFAITGLLAFISSKRFKTVTVVESK